MKVFLISVLFTITEPKRLSYDLLKSSGYEAFNEEANKKPESFQQGVDFGHVYRKSYRGSNNREVNEEREVDQPELYNVKELNQMSSKNIEPNIKDRPPVFLSPRDEVLYYKKYNQSFSQTRLNEGNEMVSKDLKTITRSPLYDFSKLLERNIANPLANRRRKTFGMESNRKLDQVKVQNFSNYFQDNTFLKKSKIYNRKSNWTTCDEFARRAVFHPDDVINTKWLPFYIWSTRDFMSSVIHTFSYPTKKIVQYFKREYAPYIKDLNWNEPKLLLKERRDILLIAGDRRGLFYGVTKQDLSSYVKGKNITIPIITMRIKIHDPYLAMMYCDDNYAVIMAELGTEPHSKEDKTLEATTLKFKGTGRPVYRDVETEVLLAEMEKKRRMEAESRKIIPIDKPRIDLEVRRRFN